MMLNLKYLQKKELLVTVKFIKHKLLIKRLIDLSTQDLVNGIFHILKSNVYEGIFNMASVNHQIGEIAELVSEIMSSKVKFTDPSITYNFKMDSSLFENTFNFKFKGNISSIVKSLL